MSGATAWSGAHAGAAPETKFEFRGSGGELFTLTIKNLLLTIVTFGVYFPWARAELLRFMIGNLYADGDPLEFHGSGGELFRGFVIAILIYFAVVAVVFVTSALLPDALAVLPILAVYASLVVLAGYAMFGSFRYRVTRTSWRGIRFAFHGERDPFLRQFLLHVVLVALTLGWGAPLFANWRREALTRATALGTRRFDYDGVGKQLMKPFVVSVLLTLPTLGLIWIWYDGRLKRHLWNATTFEGARFRLEFEGEDWFRFQLLNGLFAAVTFGIAMPWIAVRIAQYLAEHLRLVGPVDWAAIRADAAAKPGAAGEGLSEVFDVDLGIG